MHSVVYNVNIFFFTLDSIFIKFYGFHDAFPLGIKYFHPHFTCREEDQNNVALGLLTDQADIWKFFK